MKYFLQRYSVYCIFFLFLFVNFAVYFVMFRFHTSIPFGLSAHQYTAAYHFYPDERFRLQIFHFFNAIAPFDAQWYLRIASQGYPSHPKPGMFFRGIYAFFPLYPLVIFLINSIVGSVTKAAFISSNILLMCNFWSLYYVVSKLISKKIALKTIVFFFLFPLSIFFRSYFPENLYLFLLIWFAYFLSKKNYLWSAVSLSLLTVTKGNGLLLYAVFLFPLLTGIYNKTLTKRKGAMYLIISILPLFVWFLYSFFKSGHPLIFVTARQYWTPTYPFIIIFFNFDTIKNMICYSILKPFNYMTFLQIDTLFILVIATILFYAKKVLSNELWWISLCLWLGPLVMTTIVSFSRYQIVSFPLFIFLASVTNKTMFVVLCILFAIGLVYTSLFFVNWYWIG